MWNEEREREREREEEKQSLWPNFSNRKASTSMSQIVKFILPPRLR